MKKPIKLLYVEADELDRRAFFSMVRDKGLPYEATSVETLAEARGALAKSRFDLIVADYHLPDGHATELFDEVQETPLILLTGTLEEQLALRTLERGADDYLPKDPRGRHLEALPFAVEKTLHRKRIHEREQRLAQELRQSEERYRLLRQSERLVAGQVSSGEKGSGLPGHAGLPAFPGNRTLLSRYGVPVAIAALALLAMGLLMLRFGWTSPPLVLLALGAAVAAWWGGLGPGLVSTVILILGAWWAFVPPHYSFAIDHPAEIVRLVLAALCGAAISVLAEATRRAVAWQRLAIARLAAEVQERRKMEAMVREQVLLMDLSYDAVFAWSLDGAIRYWNSGAERLYGFTRAEALGRVPCELLRTRIDGGPATFIIPLQQDKHWSGELWHRTRDGRDVAVETRMVLVPGQETKSGPVVIESDHDITERRQAEEARIGLAAIVESSEDAIVSKDLDGILSNFPFPVHGIEL